MTCTSHRGARLCACGKTRYYRAELCRDCRLAWLRDHPTRATLAQSRERFARNVDASAGPDACWPWTGGRSRNGYGSFRADGHHVTASRAAIELDGRPLGPGQMACHTCDNRLCVNPRHLYVGDAFTNQRDAFARGRHPRTRRRTGAPPVVLTEAQRAEIRALATTMTGVAIARRYGVSASAVSSYILGRRRRVAA